MNEPTTIQPAYDYTNIGGKTVYGYRIQAGSMDEAIAMIPGDFLVVGKMEIFDGDYSIEIVRTF